MPFDKLVILCKQASFQFKDLSAIITKNRHEYGIKLANNKNILNDINSDIPIDSHYEIENSNSPVSGNLFLNDESYLTMTGDCFNRSANADCSEMDLDESTVSLNCSNNRDFLNKFYSQSVFNSKALTSTVSAQRTQALGNFKVADKSETSTTSIKAHKATTVTSVTSINKPSTSIVNRMSSIRASIETSTLHNDSMPPPPVSNTAASNSATTTTTTTAATVAAVTTTSATSASSVASTVPSAFSLKNGCAYSQRIAEYFVARQASLLENNEHEALSPAELNQKIDELLAFDSNFADAYYLRYLNYLRLRDYPSSLKALHDYFDRAIYAGSVSLAALNLCSLEYRFDNKENALFALKEAITSAHHEGDNACLQHCLVSFKKNLFHLIDCLLIFFSGIILELALQNGFVCWFKKKFFNKKRLLSCN